MTERLLIIGIGNASVDGDEVAQTTGTEGFDRVGVSDQDRADQNGGVEDKTILTLHRGEMSKARKLNHAPEPYR
jgi:hypothetical protein